MRERLMQLLQEAEGQSAYYDGEDAYEVFADYLINSGVSVTRWYDAELIQPDDGIWVLVWCKQSKNSYSMMDFDCWHNNKWAKNGDRVTHWMPLPQPPKES